MPHIVPIDGPDDPRVADYADVRDRDQRRRGVFLAESETVLRVLLSPLASPRFRGRSVLVGESRVAKLADVMERLPEGVPLFVMKQPAMDALVGFAIHRGVLAAVERGPAIEVGALLEGAPPRLVLGLLGLSNHDNVGGIFRSAAAFGVHAVLHDAATCDPLYRKAIRVSVGGALVVPFAELATEDDVVDALLAHGYEIVALSPRGETEIGALGRAPRRALLLGAEGPGLSERVLARARRVQIAMGGGMDSLNVSVAAGIALHALVHGRDPSPAPR